MAKVKSVWYCSDCGHKQFKWAGQCPQCREWNTLHEEAELPSNAKKFEAQQIKTSKPIRIREVKQDQTPRILSGLNEFDRLIGKGIVPGSLTLVGGHPGIGKSTLLLQLSNVLAVQGLTVLYVCGEESVEQTSLRAKRLNITTDNLLLLSETHFTHIKSQIEEIQPDVVIVDSIQIVYKGELSSAPGSVSQVRETTTEFMHIAKGMNIATFLVGHVTKSGEIAGPKILEHLVDTVLYFEGDKAHNYRLVRVVKNRFGPTDEIAVFNMTEKGLVEVANPSQIFLEERRKGVMGSAIIPTVEGSRPILIEVQALVTPTAYSTPSRRSTGIDQNRLGLLLAVLEKRLRYPMHQTDVFVSVAGGLKVTEPAIDLGIMVAVASSLRNHLLHPETTIMGEVGLSGEVRSVPRAENRIKEAVHMGFQKCVIPRHNLRAIPRSLQNQIDIQPVEMVDEAINALIPVN